MNDAAPIAAKPDLVLPPVMDVAAAARSDHFLLEGAHGNLWFEHRSSTLFITFDNLATLDDPYPRRPWMQDRVRKLGYSLLGAQSFEKDWFRHPTTPAQLAALAAAGFFDRFDRIVLMGASMGGFAALNFAPLIHGAWVLAFSPQSTMNRTIAPFEKRFQYSVRRSNWAGMPFLDAAAAVPYIPKIAMLYDPLEVEDKLHAERLDGPQVQRIPLLGATHQAIRLVIKCDALPEMMQEFAETGTLGPAFFARLRARRPIRAWRRAMIAALEKRNSPRRLLRACDYMLAEKHYAFAEAARDAVLQQHPDLAG